MKIEAGCKAVTVNSYAGNEGKIVRVLRKVSPRGYGGMHYIRDGDRWEIDLMLMTDKGVEINHLGERQLKRIDDDSRQVISWEDIADIWTPKELVNG